MTLTKQQDALATKLRDAGVPGAFAVLVASRARHFTSRIAPDWENAIGFSFFWRNQKEGHDFWKDFNLAWGYEFNHMETTGVRYDD